MPLVPGAGAWKECPTDGCEEKIGVYQELCMKCLHRQAGEEMALKKWTGELIGDLERSLRLEAALDEWERGDGRVPR